MGSLVCVQIKSLIRNFPSVIYTCSVSRFSIIILPRVQNYKQFVFSLLTFVRWNFMGRVLKLFITKFCNFIFNYI